MAHTTTLGSVKIEIVPGDSRYVRLLEDFLFYSVILGCWCKAPREFICDLESVPLIRGTNPESGVIHDLVSRKDFKPKIDKATGMAVYLEFQRYYDEMESGNWLNRSWDWIRRGFKAGFVRVWPGYWHKFNIMATYEEITA